MIEKYSFGSMKIRGIVYKSDLKIIEGSVKDQWRRKTGHKLERDDIGDLIESKPRVIVVGTGFMGMMKVDPSLGESLSKDNIKLISARTGKAVEIFNDFIEKGEKAVGAFHLTC